MFALTIIATIAAVISAGVAVWQAGIARKAQAGAEADAAEAAKQAARAVEATEDVAAAIARIGSRPEPWAILHKGPGRVYELVNIGERRVESRRLDWYADDWETHGVSASAFVPSMPMEWAAGFRALFKIVGPAPVEVTVSWRELDDDPDSPDRIWKQAIS